MNHNQKQLFVFVTAILIILSISSIVYANEALINVNNLNVRSGPGTDYEKVGQVHTDNTYQVIQEQGDWAEIEFNEGTGWVTKEYITIQTTKSGNQSSEAVASRELITIVYNQTNLRAGPSTDYEIIGTANNGTVFEVNDFVKEWYEVQRNEETVYVPKWLVDSSGVNKQLPTTQSVKNKTVVIDAGHGGRDVGATGASGNYEKDYTLLTANKLKFHLENLGAEVILTRDDDNYKTLSGRASLANLVDADVFLSIHYNSTPQYPSAEGVSSYYYSNRDKSLATTIQNELLQVTDMDDRGTHQESFQVIRENHRPSVLLELGFLSNIKEEENIQSSAFQEKLAQGIISGLNRYFSY